MKSKNIYKLIMYAILIICINSTYASIKNREVSQNVFEKKIPWTFELYNKNPKPILLLLNASEKERVALEKIGSGGKIRLLVNSNLIRSLTLSIWTESDLPWEGGLKKALEVRKEEREEEESQLIKNNPPTIKIKIRNPERKTVFLTFDRDNKVRPQTGRLKGILGVTESGLSLKNNIKQTNIQPVLKEGWVEL